MCQSAAGRFWFAITFRMWTPVLLLASLKRPVRFLMYKDIYELPYVKPLARSLRVIPISSEQRPREMIQSLRDASDAIKNGELVCIFAEGQITRIGQLLPFSPRLRTDYEGCGCADYSGRPGWCMGQYFQF